VDVPGREAVEGYLGSLEGGVRRLGEAQWGLTLEAAGWPLDVGLAWRVGLLRAQAPVLPPGRVSDHELLHRNRGLRLVRYAHAADGTVWVEGDLPPEAVDATWLDRLLGALVAAATVARERAGGRRAGA
jgi:hypothetical protein